MRGRSACSSLSRVSAALDVYRYLDYRRLLADYYRHKKSEGRGFSYRSFARRAGLASPNHLKRVMDGDRNLSERSVGQYARAMGLEGERAAFFAALVRFNQASSRDLRRRAYDEVRRFRGYQAAQIIDQSYADYHERWYVPAIREMALRADFVADPGWIAPRMIPAITPAEARAALDVLFRLGMLVEEGGRVRQRDPVVSTGEQTRGLHIARYHAEMLDAAKRAIDAVPAADRYVASLTFCVDEATHARVRERVARFRQELIGLLAEQTEGDRVLQLGVQLFPLTQGRDQ